jgi:hypothetical protein
MLSVCVLMTLLLEQEIAGRVTLSMRGEKDARIELITCATALLGTAMKPQQQQQQQQQSNTTADGKYFELLLRYVSYW